MKHFSEKIIDPHSPLHFERAFRSFLAKRKFQLEGAVEGGEFEVRRRETPMSNSNEAMFLYFTQIRGKYDFDGRETVIRFRTKLSSDGLQILLMGSISVVIILGIVAFTLSWSQIFSAVGLMIFSTLVTSVLFVRDLRHFKRVLQEELLN